MRSKRQSCEIFSCHLTGRYSHTDITVSLCRFLVQTSILPCGVILYIVFATPLHSSSSSPRISSRRPQSEQSSRRLRGLQYLTFAKLLDIHPFSPHLELINVVKLTQPREVHLPPLGADLIYGSPLMFALRRGVDCFCLLVRLRILSG